MTAPIRPPLVAALQDLADQLTAAGVRTGLDRQKMAVPGGWLRPDAITGPTNLAGDMRARCSLLLAVPKSGDAEALADLCRLLDKALTVIDPDDDTDTSVVLSVRDNALPAFRLVVDVDY